MEVVLWFRVADFTSPSWITAAHINKQLDNLFRGNIACAFPTFSFPGSCHNHVDQGGRLVVNPFLSAGKKMENVVLFLASASQGGPSNEFGSNDNVKVTPCDLLICPSRRFKWKFSKLYLELSLFYSIRKLTVRISSVLSWFLRVFGKHHWIRRTKSTFIWNFH